MGRKGQSGEASVGGIGLKRAATPSSSGKSTSAHLSKSRKVSDCKASVSTVPSNGEEALGGKPSRSATRRSAGADGSSVQQKNRRCYYEQVDFDGVTFCVGDDVYVRNGTAVGSESDAELEECRICKETGVTTMLECDVCLAGFHLSCLNPPLGEVPEGDWICPFCDKGEKPPPPRAAHRSARERFLACELWIARIQKLWREVDGSCWFRGHWFIVPEETAEGRQAHHSRREVFRSNEADNNEMETILRQCFVMNRDQFKRSGDEGDDVFLCEYEYNECWCKFKRIPNFNESGVDKDDCSVSSDGLLGHEREEYTDIEEEYTNHKSWRKRTNPRMLGRSQPQQKHPRAANMRKSYIGQGKGIFSKQIAVDRVPQTHLERAKAALSLSAIPSTLPCREREKKEIATILKGFVAAGDQCAGQCLYISGVPGTGKTATVREIIKGLWNKVEKEELPPIQFVEINGLRLPSPEHAYTMLYEALTGQHVTWKKALRLLGERFSQSKQLKGVDRRPCVLVVDELDLLITRNQSVLYNIFDWPCRANSGLLVIGIANTMDLPERLLPRIGSRMGLQRISFSPYSHKQLEEIICARLNGVQAFERQVTELVSRKVASVSGDVRRALELCRRAVELAEIRISSEICSSTCQATSSTNETPSGGLQGTRKLTQLADVDAAVKEMYEAPQVQMMRRLAKFAKIFLVAMVQEYHRTTMAETTFEKVAIAFSKLCTTNGVQVPDFDTILSIGCKLGSCRLILSESGARHRIQKLQLNFPLEDVSFALRKDEELPWLSKYL